VLILLNVDVVGQLDGPVLVSPAIDSGGAVPLFAESGYGGSQHQQEQFQQSAYVVSPNSFGQQGQESNHNNMFPQYQEQPQQHHYDQGAAYGQGFSHGYVPPYGQGQVVSPGMYGQGSGGQVNNVPVVRDETPVGVVVPISSITPYSNKYVEFIIHYLYIF
jgi:hypothetical protein